MLFLSDLSWVPAKVSKRDLGLGECYECVGNTFMCISILAIGV